MSQSELKIKTSKLHKARENTGDQVVIGFSFTSWLVETVARVFRTNHWKKKGKTNTIWDYLRQLKNALKKDEQNIRERPQLE